MHKPSTQPSAPGHFLPHLPQFLGSERASTQAPPHSDNPALQVSRHCPSLQVCVPPLPLTHALPHCPQLLESVLVSTQAASHFVRPSLH